MVIAENCELKYVHHKYFDIHNLVFFTSLISLWSRREVKELFFLFIKLKVEFVIISNKQQDITIISVKAVTFSFSSK